MSAEITNGTDYTAAYDAAHLVAALLVETGSSTAEAYSAGVKAARYGAEVMLASLREMGTLTGDLDQEAFATALEKVDKQVMPLGHLKGVAEMAEQMVVHQPLELADLQSSNEPLAALLERLANNPQSGITDALRTAILAGRHTSIIGE